MKRQELEKRLRALGWWLIREGRRHRIFTNGILTLAVPRHREINERTAKRILKLACGGRR